MEMFDVFSMNGIEPFHCTKSPPVLGFQEVVRAVEFADRPVVGLPG